MSPCLFPLTLHSSPSESSLPRPQNPAEVPRRLLSQDRGLSWGPQHQATCGLGYFSKFKARGSGDHPLVKRRTLVAAGANLTGQVKGGAQLRAPCRAVQPCSWPVTDPRSSDSRDGVAVQVREVGGYQALLFFNLTAMVYGNIVGLPFGACCQYTAT